MYLTFALVMWTHPCFCTNPLGWPITSPQLKTFVTPQIKKNLIKKWSMRCCLRSHAVIIFSFSPICKSLYLAHFLKSCIFGGSLSLAHGAASFCTRTYLAVLWSQRNLNIDRKVTGKYSLFTWAKCGRLFCMVKLTFRLSKEGERNVKERSKTHFPDIPSDKLIA